MLAVEWKVDDAGPDAPGFTVIDVEGTPVGVQIEVAPNSG